MLELKQGRWVKVHENKDAEFEAHDNVMDIVIGEDNCEAHATFNANTRTFEKAVYWMFRYLNLDAEVAVSDAIIAEVEAKAKTAGNDTDTIEAQGDGWTCEIKKLDKGVFKTHYVWSVSEPVTRKPSKKELAKIAAEQRKAAKVEAQNSENTEVAVTETKSDEFAA